MTGLPVEIARTVRSTCAPIVEQRQLFQGEFHASMIELMPEAAVLREPIGEQIAQSFVDALLWAAFTDEPEPAMAATLRGVGLQAHRAGFPRAAYQLVGHALIRTLRDAYPDWSGALSSSWIGYHSWLCEYWLRGADAGAAEGGAPSAQSQPQSQPGPPAQPGWPQSNRQFDLDAGGEGGYGEAMVSITAGFNRPSRRR